MTQPPGSGSLADQLNDLRRQVDELSRSGPQFPACRVTLGTSPTIGIGDTFAAANWATTDDQFGWFTLGAPSFITVGITGFYSLCYHSTTTGPAAGQVAGSKITVNAANVSTSSIASDLTTYTSAGEGAVQDAFRLRIKINAGDKLYWANYTSASATLQSSFLNVPTQMTVQFLSSR